MRVHIGGVGWDGSPGWGRSLEWGRSPGYSYSAADEGVEDGTGEERAVLCRACGHELTKVEAGIAVMGSHLHTFMNPAGFVFEIVCYREAPGLRGVGEASMEWSWFPGYAWQVGLCGGCGVHVGWMFRSGASGHVGLVRDRIVTPE